MAWNIDGQLTTKTIDGVSDVVTQVPWVCYETHNGVTAKMTGVVDLDYDPSSPFTAYASLTEEEVVGWVKEKLGTGAVTFYQDKCIAEAQRAYEDENDNAVNIHVFMDYAEPTGETSQDAPWAAQAEGMA